MVDLPFSVPPGQEVLLESLRPRSVLQPIAPKIRHPCWRARSTKVSAKTWRFIHPKLESVVRTIELQLLQFGIPGGILELLRNTQLSIECIPVLGRLGRNIKFIGALGTCEALSANYELVALGLTTKHGMVFQNQAGLARAF